MPRPKDSLNRRILTEQRRALQAGEFNGLCECGCGGKTEIAIRTKQDKNGERVSFAGLPKRYLKGHEPQYQKGKDSPFHTGRMVTTTGYVKVYDATHPRADEHGYIAEHVLVMEKHLGRLLYKAGSGKMHKDDEVVHHVNGVKTDNRLENLQIMTHGEHVSFHMKFSRKSYQELMAQMKKKI